MRLGVAAALAGLGVGCTDTTAPPPAVARIIVHPDSVSMLVGHSLQMTAVLLGAAGDTLSSHTLAWTSGDTLVASVSNTGLVTARAPGTVAITAASDTARGIATLRVLVPVAW